MATVKPPEGAEPPLCACGCGEAVNWQPGKGWSTYRHGHTQRGRPGSRLGAVLSEETRWRMSEAAKRRYAGKRRRDLEDTPGAGVYSTAEYREARAHLVSGKSCDYCGAAHNTQAHHRVPGDDATLIPLCAKCHRAAHAAPGAAGQHPPKQERAPLCACGCGKPVSWKRVRGWARYRKGHGNAKVPAGSSQQAPLLCACGCGEAVAFRHGVGWNEYKRGHRQRIEGGYRQK